MNRIAVFGKPGSGKSRLSRLISQRVGIPLTHLDSIMYTADGQVVDKQSLSEKHQDLLGSQSWVIDGLGPMPLFKARLSAADTLIYIELSYLTSYWLVTKRLLKGLFVRPEGWPDGSSLISGTLQSYKTLRLCPGFWNQEFLNQLHQDHRDKQIIVLRTLRDIGVFINHLKHY